MRDLPEPVEVIAEGDQFSLLSCGGGTLYVLRSKEDKTSTFIEGDEIVSFLKEYETTKTSYPDFSADQTLSQIWDQGGYSWMAVSDED
jgi:hypothetical protein